MGSRLPESATSPRLSFSSNQGAILDCRVIGGYSVARVLVRTTGDVDILQCWPGRKGVWVSQADRIRDFVLENYVRPARESRLEIVDIRAGDIHREMRLSNAVPAVCSALGSNKFEAYASVATVERSGPSNGSNAKFRFRVLKHADAPVSLPAVVEAPVHDGQPRGSIPASYADAVILVSCVKSKLPHKAPARDLYTSTLFQGARRYAEQSGLRWYVLSSMYGLVDPSAPIAPYDYTLNTLPIAERQVWAQKTFDELMLREPNLKRVVFIAGHRYREYLVPPLLRRGVKVDIPMEHLRQGEQLAWLCQQT